MAWKDQNAAAGFGEVAPPAAPLTSFGHANDALDRARSLSARVSALVDRLCGTQPTEAAGQKISGGGSVLSKLREDADSTHEAITRAMRQLDRLESDLP